MNEYVQGQEKQISSQSILWVVDGSTVMQSELKCISQGPQTSPTSMVYCVKGMVEVIGRSTEGTLRL